MKGAGDWDESGRGGLGLGVSGRGAGGEEGALGGSPLGQAAQGEKACLGEWQ